MKDRDSSDQLYAGHMPEAGSFRFGDDVARVFPDMIRRSVPGYAATLELTERLAAHFCVDGTHCYDLGCSLGATLLACARGVAGRDVTLVGVDPSAAMLDRCRERLREQGIETTLHCADARDLSFAPASLVVLNWTLQFIPPADRDALLGRIVTALVPGGAVLVSEKIVDPDPEVQALLEALHLDFKRAQGYSELEIAAKRTALERVLIPETLEAHRDRLTRAGCRTTLCLQRQLNFASILGIRS
ncbi:MAG: carboxy-S-adenosyl-L-methionine synthase CmoA [Pseudomonadales bacterium]|jgi:tRNA (cmo5U34)-methyltransferase|nr:carboxy-S-adenosyl-L-methionine synthase CmoA [Pseudomonadales bacterium]